MPRRVTITDVAREAGVSIKTVSNVLNHTGNMRDETRERVRVVIENLGYQVNIAARSMRTGATKLIGLGIADFSQPFNPYLADSIIQRARARGYGVITSTFGYHNQDVESIIEETHKLPADGWIFFTGEEVKEDSIIFQQSYPVVLASDFTAYGKVDSVTMQGYEAICEVTQRLIDKGKKRIAFAGSPLRHNNETEITYVSRIESSRFGTVFMRAKAFCDTLKRNGRELDSRYLLDSILIDHKNGAQIIKELYHKIGANQLELPDAIICANDALAFGVIHELTKHDVVIPDDIELVGFDDVPESHYSNPTLTSISPHVDDYAEHAVDFLLDRIEGYKGEVRQYTPGYNIQIRKSANI